MHYDKFVEHLEALSEIYAPNTSHLPTGDQMLNGLLLPQSVLTVDEELFIVDQLINTIKPIIEQATRWNVLLESKINYLLKTLESVQMEYKILVIVAVTGFFSFKDEKTKNIWFETYKKSFPECIIFINN